MFTISSPGLLSPIKTNHTAAWGLRYTSNEVIAYCIDRSFSSIFV
jgi:hypothetical protein